MCKLTCEICEKVFSTKSNLKTHISTIHDKQKKYECEHCNKEFGQKGNLNYHISSVHLKQKKYECEHCNKAFINKGDLKHHIRTVHLKQKKYECEHCNKAFGHRGNLNNHIGNVHLKQKIYECEYCNKGFGRKGDLKKHIKSIHTNPKPRNMTRGESAVKKVLDSHNLEYIAEKTFCDLVSFKGHCLRYDFAIVIDSDEEDYLFIEYDGAQHFKPVRWKKNESDEYVTKKFKQIKRHDRIKNRYARHHDYPLLRIKYTDFNKIDVIVNDYLKNHLNNL